MVSACPPEKARGPRLIYQEGAPLLRWVLLRTPLLVARWNLVFLLPPVKDIIKGTDLSLIDGSEKPISQQTVEVFEVAQFKNRRKRFLRNPAPSRQLDINVILEDK